MSVPSNSTASTLFFTQDLQGRLWTFHWDGAGAYGINPAEIVSGQASWVPIDPQQYFNALNEVVESKAPHQAFAHVLTQGHLLHLHLTLSPVLTPNGAVLSVAIAAQLLDIMPASDLVSGFNLSDRDAQPERLQDLSSSQGTDGLAQFSRPGFLEKLIEAQPLHADIEELLRHSVAIVGEHFRCTRCFIGLYQLGSDSLSVTAEYREDESELSWLNQEIALSDAPLYVRTLKKQTLEIQNDAAIAPTRFQGQINGLLCFEFQPDTNSDAGLVSG
ncbi:MAG: hypothetical protein AAFY15_08900 [Cyanobacteria bacterium J06648_11]